ncbi:Mono-and diacylglycerol lipase, partial [Durusdinium trenchii]
GSIREAGRLACGITWFTAGVLDPTLQAKQELKVGIALVRQDLTKLASSIALAVEVLKATVRRVQQWEWLVDMETWIELTQRFGAPCSTTQLEPWTRTVPQWFTVYKEKLNRIFAAAGAEMSDPTSELAPQFITLYLRAAVFLVMAMRQCGAPATDLEREVGVLATNTRSSLRNSWQVVLRIILESLAVPFDGSLQQIGQARLNPMSPLSMDSLREWLFQDSSDLLLQTHTDHDVEDEFFVELVRTLLRPRSMNSVKIVCPHTAKLTDRTMHAIATRLPTTKHLHMEFKTRREFTDESLKVLASHLPKELTS